MNRRYFFASAFAATQPDKSLDLFESGSGGYALYRIPGVVTTPKGSFLAYCEARRIDKGDWGETDILLRRSTDNGRTFSVPINIASVPGPIAENPAAAAQKLAASGVLYNNPLAISDPKARCIHFLFCVEYMRAFYMRSDDDGLTWSAPVEITLRSISSSPSMPGKSSPSARATASRPNPDDSSRRSGSPSAREDTPTALPSPPLSTPTITAAPGAAASLLSTTLTSSSTPVKARWRSFHPATSFSTSARKLPPDAAPCSPAPTARVGGRLPGSIRIFPNPSVSALSWPTRSASGFSSSIPITSRTASAATLLSASPATMAASGPASM